MTKDAVQYILTRPKRGHWWVGLLDDTLAPHYLDHFTSVLSITKLALLLGIRFHTHLINILVRAHWTHRRYGRENGAGAPGRAIHYLT